MRLDLCGEENLNLRELVNQRSVGALPVGGRYRAIDFILSNMVNSGIRNIRRDSAQKLPVYDGSSGLR